MDLVAYGHAEATYVAWVQIPYQKETHFLKSLLQNDGTTYTEGHCYQL